MYITGFVGIIVTTSCLAAMTAEYAGTKNKVGNGFGILFMFLYLAFQGYVQSSAAALLMTRADMCDAEPSVIHPCTFTFLKSSPLKSVLLAWDGLFSGSLPVSGFFFLFPLTILLTVAATIILLETAPMGFNNVGWKYYLVIICWSAAFIPGRPDRSSVSGIYAHRF